MPKFMHSMVKPTVVDLTNVSTDYPLQVGETATITYTSATSVPLHVATVEGEYELHITQPITDTAFTSAKGLGLLPNNTSIPAGKIIRQQSRVDSNSFSCSTDSSTYTRIHFASYNPLSLEAKISTKTAAKTVSGKAYGRESVSSFQVWDTYHIWNDTTTQWTSLGTLELGQAQSGKIVIKRII